MHSPSHFITLHYITPSKSNFLPTAHIPIVSPSPNEPSLPSQTAETNPPSINADPPIPLNAESTNSQNVTLSSPFLNAEPTSVNDEHSNTVSDFKQRFK